MKSLGATIFELKLRIPLCLRFPSSAQFNLVSSFCGRLRAKNGLISLQEYKSRVEFFVTPFLVQEWEVVKNGSKKETLRLDLVSRAADKYKNADIIVFNTGHWWTHGKTSLG